jgi:hypothetical protein
MRSIIAACAMVAALTGCACTYKTGGNYRAVSLSSPNVKETLRACQSEVYRRYRGEQSAWGLFGYVRLADGGPASLEARKISAMRSCMQHGFERTSG